MSAGQTNTQLIGGTANIAGGSTMDLGLKGKQAVITGGSVGIGLAVAQALAAEGVHVALIARDGARASAAGGRDPARPTACRRSASGPTCPRPTTSRAPLAEIEQGFRRRRHPDQQRRHRQQRNHHERAGREVAVLLGPARDGRGAHVTRADPGHAPARRRRDPEQRLDLRQAAAGLRADLQHHQGRADDVLEVPGQRGASRTTSASTASTRA